ncbi:MAG: hypothetical protein JWO22_2052 [Frankiales bacterium]|nr:hypothetical protein [Frankiales bacterium]
MSIAVEHPVGIDVAVVTLAGEHDLSTVDVLRRVLNDLTGASPLVVLDLAQCLFVDSTILGAIAGTARRISSAGGRVVAINVGGIVGKALRITGLDAVLSPTAGLDEAFVSALGQLGWQPLPADVHR